MLALRYIIHDHRYCKAHSEGLFDESEVKSIPLKRAASDLELSSFVEKASVPCKQRKDRVFKKRKDRVLENATEDSTNYVVSSGTSGRSSRSGSKRLQTGAD